MARHPQGLVAGLGIAALLLPGARAIAQQTGDSSSFVPASVHVPPQCAGIPTSRCPLVVFPQVPKSIARSVSAARAMIEWQRALADKYGTILLVPDSSYFPSASFSPAPASDTLLQRVLRTYAVDPDKVALAAYGFVNQCVDVKPFGQVALLSPVRFYFESPLCPAGGQRPRAGRVYLDGGLGGAAFIPEMTWRAQLLRQQGYAVDLVLGLRGYAVEREDFERMWRWLREGWTASASAAPPAATQVSDEAGPLLTARALDQLITFWGRFMREPDSIRTTARLAYQQQIRVSVRSAMFRNAAPEMLRMIAGQYDTVKPTQPGHFTLRMMDTPALAARYPSVRAALRTAGLTARQADAYRQALIVAAANRDPLPWVNLVSGPPLAPVPARSRLGHNIAFLRAPQHKEALKALGATGMWITP